MFIKTFNQPGELAAYTSGLLIHEINRKPGLLLCAATGSSPTETYKHLVDRKQEFDPGLLRIIKLDEWGGVPMDYPHTCEQYLQEQLVKPLNIPANHYFGFNSCPHNAESEVNRMKKIIEHEGPVDICILGLGMNGHIALNEPGDVLAPHCHVARLSKQSQLHPMIDGLENKPSYGLTLGMADILNSKMIILIIQGANKKDVIDKFMSQEITTSLPASFLWLHPNVPFFMLKPK